MINLAGLYAPKDPQKALNSAKNAYKVSPDDPSVTHTLGRLAFMTGDYPWSVNLLQLAARDLPQDPKVLYDLGQAFYSVGRVSGAVLSMQNALQSGASFPQADAARRFLAMTEPGGQAGASIGRAITGCGDLPEIVTRLRACSYGQGR